MGTTRVGGVLRQTIRLSLKSQNRKVLRERLPLTETLRSYEPSGLDARTKEEKETERNQLYGYG